MRVLVVDDEHICRVTTTRQLVDAGHEAGSARNGFDALDQLQKAPWDIVVTDMRMPNMGGLRLLSEIREHHASVDVVVMTAHGSVETAVEAMQLGAADYLTKPFTFRELDARLRKLEGVRGDRRDLARLRAAVREQPLDCGWVGNSVVMREVAERVRLFAPHDAPVLVTGETGTGKELVARALHHQGTRASNPFVPVSCGSIPRDLAESLLLGHERGAFTGATNQRRGFFEQANGGLLLLDDVDDLSMDIQMKLLRVLQEGRLTRVGATGEIPVDVRVVATTKVDLNESVKQGRFRADVFYRLRGLEINLPPLRERGGDILLLASHFLRLLAADAGEEAKRLTPEAGDFMSCYEWPGNVRELRRTIEAATILSQDNEIRSEHLPLHVHRDADAKERWFSLELDRCTHIPFLDVVHRFEDALIDWALQRGGGQQVRAAELLGLPRTTFQGKLTRRNH